MHVLRSVERSEAYVHLSWVIGALAFGLMMCVFRFSILLLVCLMCERSHRKRNYKMNETAYNVNWQCQLTRSHIFFNRVMHHGYFGSGELTKRKKINYCRQLDSRTLHRHKSIGRSHLWSCDTRASTNGLRNLTSRAANLVKMMLVA